ncbi:hypothetical protein [Amycolatopsis sp. NPDC004378]
MIDATILMKLVDSYRKMGLALGVISGRFDSHATVVGTAEDGLGAIARGHSIDLYAYGRRLDALADDVLNVMRKQAAAGKAKM